MVMAEVMDGAITADTGIITGGVEVMATTMVGGIIAITGDSTSRSRAQCVETHHLRLRETIDGYRFAAGLARPYAPPILV